MSTLRRSIPFELIERIAEFTILRRLTPHFAIYNDDRDITYRQLPFEPHTAFRLATLFRHSCLQSRLLPYIRNSSIDEASSRGDIELLSFWRDTALPHLGSLVEFHDRAFLWTANAVDDASFLGRLDVLKWWKASADSGTLPAWGAVPIDGRSLPHFGQIAIDDYDARSHRRVLCWSEKALNMCSNVEVLNWWWRESGLELQWDLDKVIKYLCQVGAVDALEFWNRTGLIKEDQLNEIAAEAISSASGGGHVGVLVWWKENGLKVERPEEAMILATKHFMEGNESVLCWLRDDMVPPDNPNKDSWWNSDQAKRIQDWWTSGYEAIPRKLWDWWRDESGLIRELEVTHNWPYDE
ncbi:hypothetical protein BJ742DRAFT_117156 [Cladochytrium replicatum]|nr:hypothetical protein BJ742DRAFT_117156 [Cladochytrium replicatum]